MRPVLLLLLAIGRRSAVTLTFLLLLALVPWGLSAMHDWQVQWVMAVLFGSISAMGMGLVSALALPALQAHTPLQQAPGRQRTMRRLLWSLGLGICAPLSVSVLLLPATATWWALPWSLGHMALAAALGMTAGLLPGLGMNWFSWGVRLAGALGLVVLWYSLRFAVETLPTKYFPPSRRMQEWLALAAGVSALLTCTWMASVLARRMCDSRTSRLDPGWFARTVSTSVLGASSREPTGDRLARWLALRASTPWGASPWELSVLALLCVGVGYLGSVWTDAEFKRNAWLSVMAWAVAVTVSALPFLQMPWMSPRAMLAPGGLQREGLAMQLFGVMLRHNALRTLFDIGLLSVALGIGWVRTGGEFGLGTFAALMAVGAALLPVNFAVSLALLRAAGSRWREPLGLLLFLQPLASLTALGSLGLRPQLDEPATLWAWAALSWPISLLVAGLLLKLLARPLETMDLGRMPASPMSGNARR